MPARGRRGSDVLFACHEIDGLASGFARVISCLDVPNQGAEILAIYESCFLGQLDQRKDLGEQGIFTANPARKFLDASFAFHRSFSTRGNPAAAPVALERVHVARTVHPCVRVTFLNLLGLQCVTRAHEIDQLLGQKAPLMRAGRRGMLTSSRSRSRASSADASSFECALSGYRIDCDGEWKHREVSLSAQWPSSSCGLRAGRQVRTARPNAP